MYYTIINQGLIFSLVATAVFMTSRVLRRDDLSVEGSFGLGSAACATLLAANVNAIVAMLVSMILGALVGLTTATLHTKLRMNHLMAGLVSTTGCFSISLYLAGATKTIYEENTIFYMHSLFKSPLGESSLLFFIALFFILSIIFILKTEIGLLLRCVGENPRVVLALGKSGMPYQALGFLLANSLTALSGALFVQWSGFFSITGNIGTLITGLASLMLLELFSKRLSILIIVSSMIYQSMFALTIKSGISPVWNNFLKALFIVILVMISNALARRKNEESHA